MNYWLLTIPLLTAVAGWLLNKLALGLILRNRPGSWLVTQQKQWSIDIGRYVSAEFFNTDDIRNKITDPAHYALVRPEIEQHIDDFLSLRLKEVFPMIAMFIGERTTKELKTHFMNELDQLFPQVISRYADSLASGFSPEKLVQEKLSQMEPGIIIRQKLNRQLRLFALWGAVTGFLIGLFSIILICFFPK